MDDGSDLAGRDHERQVMSSLLARFQVDLFSFALHMVHNESTAEDVVQLAFVAAFRALRAGKKPFLEPISEWDVRRWLFKVVKRKACTEYKRQRKWVFFSRFNPDDWRGPGAVAPFDTVLDLLVVRQAFELLGPDLQAVMELHLVHRYTAREIAEITGTTPTTVEWRLRQGMRELRMLLRNTPTKAPAPDHRQTPRRPEA